MADILAQNLSGKAVMGTDGAELGELYNITMDLKSGTLEHLLVTPLQEGPALDFPRDDDGHYEIPVGNVQAVKDHIVVDR